MKILACGDLHGTHSSKFLKEVKKEKPDLILCNGDLADTAKIRDTIFKNWERLNQKETLAEIIGEKKYQTLLAKAIISMYKPLQMLNKTNAPVILIWGNCDYTNERSEDIPYLNQQVKEFENITFVARARKITHKDVQILANSGYRYPGEKGFYKDKLKDKNYKKSITKTNKKWENKLKRLFKNKDQTKTTIFLVHDPPRGILDKINNKQSPMNKKNLGDEYYTKFIKKYQPDFCVCGHIHEKKGTKKLGKTKVINTGALHDKDYAIIDTNSKKVLLKKIT